MRLVYDVSIPSSPFYRQLKEDESLAEIPDYLTKTVAFLQYRDNDGEFHFDGTAFFVSTSFSNGSDRAHTYAVTAHHCIHGIKKASSDGLVYLRINFRDGAAQRISIPIDDWRVHPDDPTIDVAIAPIGMNTRWDQACFPVKSFADDASIERNKIGMGNVVFFIGLFPHHKGTHRNVPIIRMGNIAAMPKEPVQTPEECFEEMEAYLIENRSMGGFSGSPVFVSLIPFENAAFPTEAPQFVGFVTRSNLLLGLVHGHWRSPIPTTASRDITENTGISIVVPARKIFEVINHPELVKMREKIEAKVELTERGLVVPDSLITEKEGPFTKQDFEAALKKVSTAKSDEEKT
ncbi:MAG: serine protease [Desulfomonilaceae bacterium]